MIEFSKLNEVQLLVFGLILLRMISFVFTAAIFNSPVISSPLKVLLSLSFAMMMFDTVAKSSVVNRINDLQDQIILLAAYEVVMGLIIGFMTRMFFFSISMAGEMISMSLGLGQAQVFNPLMNSQGNAIEQFLVMVATLLFFALNGHHVFVQGLMESFQNIPLGRMSIDALQLKNIALMGQDLLIIAIKMSAPIVISMFIVQVGVGLLSRAVPQINVLTTSSSLTALLGIAVLIIALPLLVNQMSHILDMTHFNLFLFIKKI